MSRLLYVDPIGGAAGDMLLAALLDAGAPIEVVRRCVDAVLPGRFAIEPVEVRRAGLRGVHLRISAGSGPATAAGELAARPAGELLAALDRAGLEDAVRDRSRLVVERMVEAEARAHGLTQDAVALHELGDDDTLLDVVGVVAALEAMAVRRVLVGPIPMGRGMQPGWHSHGPAPLPATATLELLRGFIARGAGEGETVTPTAAAIFAALGEPVERFPDLRIEATGYGAGTRDPGGIRTWSERCSASPPTTSGSSRPGLPASAT